MIIATGSERVPVNTVWDFVNPENVRVFFKKPL